MKFSGCVTKLSTTKQQTILVFLSYMLMQGLVRSEYMYTVNVASQSTWVNLGDNYVAYCNIPGLESQEILNNLEFRWYHNSQQVTKLWKVVSSKLA